ncbi:hypothetical protein F5882DRAFT_479504 [Hyaloscypha sp. PMI_1271]|nr:hypothetical protein F5882DRAFT_479504 [Hyaloscypha sp. PMI_1271]
MTGVVKAVAGDKRTLTKIEIGQGYGKSVGISNDSMPAPKTYVGDMRSIDQIQGPTNEYLPVAGYMTDFSEESDELYDGDTAVAETIPSTETAESTSPLAEQFRLSEMNEDLLHPVRYNTKLRRLQSHVWKESAVGQQSLRVGIQDDKTNLTPDSRLQECLRILACIQQNITFLRDAGFCTSSATILQVDPARTQVALVRSVDLDELAHLGGCIDNTNTSSENLTLLRHRYIDLLGELWFSVGGDSVIVGLRVLDLVLVTHVYSHIGNFDGAMSKDTSTTQMFQISDRASSVVTHSGSLERGIIAFCRRTLKCLNGFLGGEQVWVLHGCDTDPMDCTELWLSTTPDTFADIWGPMWTVTNNGKPDEILRYDLEHGSVVPTDPTPENCERVVEATSNEDICHWISNNELQELERTSDLTSLPQITRPRLLIGAGVHSITRNPVCSCNLTDAKHDFESSGYLRFPGSSPGKWVTDSRTVGTTAGGASVGAPTIQYSHTMKNTRVPTKEAFYKRWKNSSPDLRPWPCLLLRFGLQVSICTRNGRKVRLVDLLAGDTMRAYLNTHPTYAQETWRVEFEQMLDTNPTRLGTFIAGLPRPKRKYMEKYISDCLEMLVHTGIGRGNDQFVALWVLNGQAWEVAFPHGYHEWTGFAEESSFVVLEKCLENKFGRRCCQPRVGASNIPKDLPAVLEVFLTLSKRAERPDGLREKRPTNGRPYWDCRRLRGHKHCIKLGKLGVLKGEGACSKRVLVGKWSAESLVAAGARRVTKLLGADETHTECIHDDSDDYDSNDNILPLPYLIQDI